MKPSRFPLIVTLLIFLFFYAPLTMMIVQSFRVRAKEDKTVASQPTAVEAGGEVKPADPGWTWSTRRYVRLMNNSQVLRVTYNTVFIGTLTAIFSTILGTMSALALYKYRSKLQSIHSSLLYIPLILPEILVGISLLICFTVVKAQLGISFGHFAVIAAHTSFCTSYVAVVVMASLMDFDFTLLEAARDLGASSWQATRRVMLPLLWPAIAAGAILAFTLSLDDFIITEFVKERNSTTLPVFIYSLFKHRSLEDIYALCSVLFGATFLLVAFIMLFVGRKITKNA